MKPSAMNWRNSALVGAADKLAMRGNLDAETGAVKNPGGYRPELLEALAPLVPGRRSLQMDNELDAAFAAFVEAGGDEANALAALGSLAYPLDYAWIPGELATNGARPEGAGDWSCHGFEPFSPSMLRSEIISFLGATVLFAEVDASRDLRDSGGVGFRNVQKRDFEAGADQVGYAGPPSGGKLTRIDLEVALPGARSAGVSLWTETKAGKLVNGGRIGNWPSELDWVGRCESAEARDAARFELEER